MDYITDYVEEDGSWITYLSLIIGFLNVVRKNSGGQAAPKERLRVHIPTESNGQISMVARA
jgi:hypothetical protein